MTAQIATGGLRVAPPGSGWTEAPRRIARECRGNGDLLILRPPLGRRGDCVGLSSASCLPPADPPSCPSRPQPPPQRLGSRVAVDPLLERAVDAPHRSGGRYRHAVKTGPSETLPCSLRLRGLRGPH
jgi:hypothetical protein